MTFFSFATGARSYAVSMCGWDKNDGSPLLLRDLDTSGYTWAGVIRSLLLRQIPEVAPAIEIDPEPDNVSLVSPDQQALERAVAVLQAALNDHSLLLDAIDHSQEEL